MQIVTKMKGHITIKDRETGEILVDKDNAIHYENMSEAIALSLANRPNGFIQSFVFGNGASTVSGTGAISYFPPNVTGQDAALYNQTYTKVINDQSPLDPDVNANYIRVQHSAGNVFSDIVITCVLDYGEPTGQEFYDNSTSLDSAYVFDELGIISYDSTGPGKLLTHVVFHPVQKSLNRSIEIIYTIRIYLS
jgi:hypothetical protein